MRDIFEAVLAAEAAGDKAALATVVATTGSTPRKAPARMLIHADGRLVGTIGGGCLEAEMIRLARQVIEERRPRLVQHELTAAQAGEDGLVCGGRMTVFIEPIEGAPTLCIFGAGHVAQPLATMAKMAGFRVEVADDRVKFANADRFPTADSVVVADFARAAEGMTLGPHSYAVIVTRGHQGDLEALLGCLKTEVPFIGVLGSRAKAVHLGALLEERGVPSDALARVHIPLGLAIGSESPEEIAVSILAELIAMRRGRDPGAAGSMGRSLQARSLRSPAREELLK